MGRARVLARGAGRYRPRHPLRRWGGGGRRAIGGEGSGEAWKGAADLGEGVARRRGTGGERGQGRLLTEGGEGDAWASIGLAISYLGFLRRRCPIFQIWKWPGLGRSQLDFFLLLAPGICAFRAGVLREFLRRLYSYKICILS